MKKGLTLMELLIIISIISILASIIIPMVFGNKSAKQKPDVINDSKSFKPLDPETARVTEGALVPHSHDLIWKCKLLDACWTNEGKRKQLEDFIRTLPEERALEAKFVYIDSNGVFVLYREEK